MRTQRFGFTRRCTSSFSRLGSSYALVMGFAVAGMAAIAVSSTFVDQRFESMHRSNYRQIALGALDAVLTRRETTIVRLAQVGDPEDFARLHANYGEEQLSNCRVRWKIEPAIIREAMQVKTDNYGNAEVDSSGNPVHDPAGFRRFVQNPGSFSLFSSDDDKFEQWQNSVQSSIQNDFVYVYRVSGESRFLPGGEEWSFNEAKAVVQAVRYVAIAKQPVFRYVIFYAQEGPKGDLEFTHVPEMDIKGSVQSNGSIYLGGGPLVNNWNALTAPTNPGPYDQQPTRLGMDKDGKPVRVNGVYGIFRLDKKSLFSQFNDYPMSGVSPGVPSDVPSVYNTDLKVTFPGEEGSSKSAVYAKPKAGPTLASSTWEGRIINPNRVENSSNLQTTGGIREINGIEVRGLEVNGLPANDSRQENWKVHSMQDAPVGFQGYARTRATGGGSLKLPAQLGNRAFEVQKLVYRELDGDPSTDEHEFAQPLFITDQGLSTTEIPNITDPIIEDGGRYVSYAFGEGGQLYFRRRSHSHYGVNDWYDETKPDAADIEDKHRVYNGWDVVTQTGDPAPRNADSVYGLIIRERPNPDNTYFSMAATIGQDNFYYMPYAYGKHTRAPIWPLWEMDVVSTRNDLDGKLISTGITDGHDKYIKNYNDFYHFDKSAEFHAYADGGRMQLRGAMWPGPDGRHNFWDRRTSEPTENAPWETDIRRDGWWDAYSGYRHYPEYYRENWRFYHMQRPKRKAGADGQGLTTEFYANRTFEGQPVAREVGYYFKNWGSGRPHASLPTDKFSIRYQGFIKAPSTGSYRIWANASDGCRVWVNGELVVDAWIFGNPADRTKQDVLLQEDEYYPIVVEYFENTGTAACILKWRTPKMDENKKEWIPQSVLSPLDHTAFKLKNIKAAQMRISAVDMPTGDDVLAAGQKVGLMMRSLGEPPKIQPTNPTAGGPIIQPASGPIVIEAEALSRKSIAGTADKYKDREWEEFADPTAGGGMYLMVPNLGHFNSKGNANAPMLEYPVTFHTPGTYYVHVRIAKDASSPGGEGANDSMWFGYGNTWFVSNSKTPGSGHYDWTILPKGSPGTSWYWQAGFNKKGDMKVEVLTPGVVTIKFMMREDGTKFDKIVIHKDNAYVPPAGIGPEPTDGGWGAGGAMTGKLTAPEACVSHIADGRDPYLAILHNEQRGVFLQYRGVKAKSQTLPQTTFFIGSDGGKPDDGAGNSLVDYGTGETGLDPGALTRTVTVTPKKISEGVSGGSWVHRKPSQIRDRYQDVHPAKKVKVISLGDGTNYEIHYFQGPIKRWTYKQSEKQAELKATETWRWTLQPSRDNPTGQIFLPQSLVASKSLSDYDKQIRFYKKNTGSDSYWTTNMKNYWTFNKEYVQHSFIKYGGKIYSYGPKEYSANHSSGGTEYGDGSTIWNFYENKNYWRKKSGGGYEKKKVDYRPYKLVGGKKYIYGSTSAFKKEFGSADVKGNPGYPEGGHPDAPADSVLPNDPVPATPVLGNNWDEWVTAAGGNPTDPVTFHVKRNRKLYADVNSYVTRLGKWHDSPIDQNAPYPSWATITPAQTHSIRPDLWFEHNPGNVPLQKGVHHYSPSTEYNGVVPVNASKRERRILASWYDDLREWESGIPLESGGTHGDLWMRMERVDDKNFCLMYYRGLKQEADLVPGDWKTIRDDEGNRILYNTETFGDWVLLGPCLQSGHKRHATDLKIRDLSMEYIENTDVTVADPPHILDKSDWEALDEKGATFTSRYMASQYQVFWGPYDITEDFFAYRDPNGELIANEAWIYNAREFQSQSRWWACGAEKEDHNNDGKPEDAFLFPTSDKIRTARELFSKQTLLDIDMKALQNYLIERTLSQATEDKMEGGYNEDAQDISTEAKSNKLKDRFNGLFYFARTNRYPWNPNLDTSNQDGHNPWTWPLKMPNQTKSSDSLMHAIHDVVMEVDPNTQAQMYDELLHGNGAAYSPGNAGRSRLVDINTHPRNMINGEMAGALNIPNRSAASMAYKNLQPFPLANAPALRWQEFHHGVRIHNAEAIDWGLEVTQSGEPPQTTPDFGKSKSTIVSPNQLFVKGNLNTQTYTATFSGSDQAGKFTPLAIVGDAVYLLSNNWDDYLWQNAGLRCNKNSGVTGGGSLYIPFHTGLPDATSTTYNCSIITHNQPTTRDSVRDGEAASIITVMLHLEDWLWAGSDSLTKQDINFTGSLVVMDSRRYSSAYLLDNTKQYGRTPWGTIGWHQYKGYHEDRLALSDYSSNSLLVWGDGSPNSAATLNAVYRAGNRNFEFNEDLLTSAGTPPFTPFGVTATGTGAWVDFIK